MRHLPSFAGLFLLGLTGFNFAELSTAPSPSPKTGISVTPEAITPGTEPLVKVVEKTLPAVVNITAETIIRGQVDNPFSAYFGRYYSAPQSSLGSGVFVSPDGYIITCAHVIDRAEDGKVKITLTNGSLYQAKVLSSDPDRDLALLKIIDEKDKFPFIDLKVLSPNLLGQTVVALGNPVGYQSSVSRGILSARNRTVNTEQGKAEGLLQTDAAINPGNSGGPMVDIEGNFVGISSAKVAGAAIGGLGFGIPGDVVAVWALDSIAIAKGEKKAPPAVLPADVIRSLFGMTVQELTPELAQSFNLPSSNGLLIADVEKGSPSEKANIRPGMLLVRIGNVSVFNASSLPRQLNKVKSGDQVSFTIAIAEQRGAFTIQRSQTATLTAR